jgi:predicted phage-related endonuclease
MSSSNIVNTYATNSPVIMNTKKKKEEEKTSAIQVSNRLKNSIKQMEINDESNEDIIWRLIQHWDVSHGTHVPYNE